MRSRPTPTSTSATCTGARAKLSDSYDACLPDVNCARIKDPTGSTCADDQKAYVDCVTACGT